MARSRTTFAPGHKSTGGRPKNVTEVQKLARTQTKRAIEILTDAMENATRLYGANNVAHPDYRVKVAAAEALLNRGHGSPYRAEATEHSDADQARILALQAKKLEAETRLLEQRLKAEEQGDGDTDPASDDRIDQMMRDRFGGVQHYGDQEH